MFAPPNRDRIAERRSAIRAEILSAAWETAREQGIGGLTLRDVAARVGMKPPSVYSHFASKNAIYEAMFEQVWQEFGEVTAAAELPNDPRAALKSIARTYFEFAVGNPARHALMNQLAIPGFEPSPASYAPAVRAIEHLRQTFAGLGVHDEAAVDLYTAITGGLVNQQLANDPGGNRWARLLDRAIDMYADEMGVPAPG
jgi:AcrR family transcriptional regulator